MWYIVWQEPYESYRYPQGDGYFVGYKNKCADKFSKNWIEAKKYKSLTSSIERLKIKIPHFKPSDSHITMDDAIDIFLQLNTDDVSRRREMTLNKILDEKSDFFDFQLKKGRIEKISESGEFLGSANKEIIDYVKLQIQKNWDEIEKLNRKLKKLGLEPSPKIDVSTKEYADDFMDFFS